MGEATGKSRLPPPLPNVLGVALAFACDRIWPWPVANNVLYVLPFGIVLAGIGIALGIFVHRVFKEHHTPANPYKETTALIASGPFGFSRNPIYVAFQLFHGAAGLLLNSIWVLLTIVPAVVTLHYMVILREEIYLERKFGDIYLEYKSRIRRWV